MNAKQIVEEYERCKKIVSTRPDVDPIRADQVTSAALKLAVETAGLSETEISDAISELETLSKTAADGIKESEEIKRKIDERLKQFRAIARKVNPNADPVEIEIETSKLALSDPRFQELESERIRLSTGEKSSSNQDSIRIRLTA